MITKFLKKVFGKKCGHKVDKYETLISNGKFIKDSMPVCKGPDYEIYLISRAMDDRGVNSVMFDGRFIPIYRDSVYCAVVKYEDVWYTLLLDFNGLECEDIIKYFRVALMVELNKKVRKCVDWKKLPFITKTALVL